MNYADLTVLTVGFIGFVASLIEIYNFLSKSQVTFSINISPVGAEAKKKWLRA